MELKDFDNKIKETSGLGEEATGIIDRLHTVVTISNIDLGSLNLAKIETSSTHTRLNATNSVGEYISVLIYSKDSFTSTYHIVVSTSFRYIKFSSDRDKTNEFDICVIKPFTQDMKCWCRVHSLDDGEVEVIRGAHRNTQFMSQNNKCSYTTDMTVDEAIDKIKTFLDKPEYIHWEIQPIASDEYEDSGDKGTCLNRSLGTMPGSGSN